MSEKSLYLGLRENILKEGLKALPPEFSAACFVDGMVGEAAIGVAFAYLHGDRLEKWLRRWLKKVIARFETADGRRLAYSIMKTLIPYRYAIVLADDSHGELEELLVLQYVAIYVNLPRKEVKVIDSSTGPKVIQAIIWRLINNPPEVREVTEG